jgi:hypothetical protein
MHQLDAVKSLPRRNEEISTLPPICIHIAILFFMSARRLYQATSGLGLSHAQNLATQISPVADWRLNYAIANVIFRFLLLCKKQPTVPARYPLRAIPERLLPNEFASFESKINHERAKRPMALSSRKLFHHTSYPYGISTTVAWGA